MTFARKAWLFVSGGLVSFIGHIGWCYFVPPESGADFAVRGVISIALGGFLFMVIAPRSSAESEN